MCDVFVDEWGERYYRYIVFAWVIFYGFFFNKVVFDVVSRR